MKRAFWLSLFLLTATMLTAQVQRGRVKTLGRPNKPGKGLSGVLINVSDVPNDMVSGNEGTFSFSPKGTKYMMSRIRKNNYQLIDQSIIGRLYPTSTEVPIEIVMVSSQDLMNDKQRIEDRAYQRAEQNYKEKIAELEKRLAQHAINESEANKERVRLGENYQRYLNLISQMAERYATTDYDGISKTNERIMQYIERAELEKADSLLRTKGDMGQREAELKEQEQLTEEFIIKSKQAIEAKRNDLAQDYYNKHSIFLGNYQNDSAAYCMERRALLDTTRIEWTLQAGAFISDYLADYPRAIRHYRQALSSALAQYGNLSLQAAVCNNHIGTALMAQGRYATAMDHFMRAKSILDSLPNRQPAELAECYQNMAAVYLRIDEPPSTNAITMLRQAKPLIIEIYGEESLQYARLLTMEATPYSKGMTIGKSAIANLNHARTIYETQQGTHSSEAAQTYCSLGQAYINSGDSIKAHENIQRAIDIWQSLFGERHPMLSYAYSLQGDCYMKQKDFNHAEASYTKALADQKQLFGSAHPFVADCYVKQSNAYRRQGKFGHAAKYMMDALGVLLQLEEYKEQDVINLFQHVDAWLNTMEVIHQNDLDIAPLKTELNHYYKIYSTTSNKKIRLKHIKL